MCVLPQQQTSAPYNPHPQKFLPPAAYSTKSDKIICVLVGLPARGKSYISRRLSQFLSFFYGVPCKLFNVGEYRRDKAGNSGGLGRLSFLAGDGLATEAVAARFALGDGASGAAGAAAAA